MSSNLASSISSNARSGMRVLRGAVGKQVSRVDQIVNGGDVGGWWAIGVEVRYALADDRVRAGHAVPRSQRGPEVEPLRCAERLDRQHLLSPVDRVAKVEG